MRIARHAALAAVLAAAAPAFAAECSPEAIAAQRVATVTVTSAEPVAAAGGQLWTLGERAPNLADPAAPWGPDPKAAPEAWKFGGQVSKYWLRRGPDDELTQFDIDPRTGIVGAAALADFDRHYDGINTYQPERLLPFIHGGRKLILYHGFSDPGISPYRTTQFYEQLAVQLHGYARAQENVELFMVPGMHRTLLTSGGAAHPS